MIQLGKDLQNRLIATLPEPFYEFSVKQVAL